MNLNIFLLAILSLWCQQMTRVDSLYFHIRETERKCFIEEVPDETLVVGKYKVQIFDKDSNQYQPTPAGIGMHVEVKDPEQQVVLSKVRFFILYYESYQMNPILVPGVFSFSDASIFVLGQFILKSNLKSSFNSLPNK